MATLSGWFKASKEKNIPLEKYIVVNYPKDLARLHSSGLPFYDLIIIDGEKYEKEKIRIFSKKYKLNWVRVYNKNKKGERYYKLNLKNYDDIISFIESLNINLKDFDIQIFEYQINRFGGNIVSENNKISIEIIKGKQELVSRSYEPFFHGAINNTGRLNFLEKDVPKKIKAAAEKVIKHIKIERNEFLKGYFEFVVSDENKVYFVDYKLGFK